MELAPWLQRSFDPRRRLTAEQLATAIPERNPIVTLANQPDGSVVLSAPLEQTATGIIAWMAKRVGQSSTKSFELEPIGAYVWELCNGKNSFAQISRSLRERYKMNRVEADAALSAFLQTLSQKRLVSLKVTNQK